MTVRERAGAGGARELRDELEAAQQRVAEARQALARLSSPQALAEAQDTAVEEQRARHARLAESHREARTELDRLMIWPDEPLDASPPSDTGLHAAALLVGGIVGAQLPGAHAFGDVTAMISLGLGLVGLWLVGSFTRPPS